MPTEADPTEERTGIRRIDFIDRWYDTSPSVGGLPGKELREELHGWSTQLGKRRWVAEDPEFGARAAELATTRKTYSYPSDVEHWLRVGRLYDLFGVHLARFTTSVYVDLRGVRPPMRGDTRAVGKVSDAMRGIPIRARQFMTSEEFPDGPVTGTRPRLEQFVAAPEEYEQRVHDWCRKELIYLLRLVLDALNPDSVNAETLREAIDELLYAYGEPKQQKLREPTREESDRARADIAAVFDGGVFVGTFKYWSGVTGIPDGELRDMVEAKALPGYLRKIVREQEWRAERVVEMCIRDIVTALYLKKLNGLRSTNRPTRARRKAPAAPSAPTLPDDVLERYEQMYIDLLEYPLYAPDGAGDSWEKRAVLGLLRMWIDRRDAQLLDDTAVVVALFGMAEAAWRDGVGPDGAVAESAGKAAATMRTMLETGLDSW